MPIKCEICGKDTIIYDNPKLCDNCWQVMDRFEEFIKSKKARKWVLKMLKKVEKGERKR